MKKAVVSPINNSYTNPYRGIITDKHLKLSNFDNWSDLIVDAAKFYVNNLKENKPNLHYANAMDGK